MNITLEQKQDIISIFNRAQAAREEAESQMDMWHQKWLDARESQDDKKRRRAEYKYNIHELHYNSEDGIMEGIRRTLEALGLEEVTTDEDVMIDIIARES